MFGLGHLELMILLGVLFLLFGGRLPSISRSLGASVHALQRGLNEGMADDDV